MPTVTVFGAKGGVGASLLAANLGLWLEQEGRTLLVDLVPGVGSCDLLLDLEAERSWRELLPVAGELRDKYLELTTETHSSGLSLLAAPNVPPSEMDDDSRNLAQLIQALSERWTWLVLDAGSGGLLWGRVPLEAADHLILVTTPDPPALRAAGRWVKQFRQALDGENLGLVLTQIGPGHPANPHSVAEALGLPLLGVLPLDRKSAGEQVHFGRPAVLERRSRLGASVRTLANGLVRRPADSTGTQRPEKVSATNGG